MQSDQQTPRSVSPPTQRTPSWPRLRIAVATALVPFALPLWACDGSAPTPPAANAATASNGAEDKAAEQIVETHLANMFVEGPTASLRYRETLTALKTDRRASFTVLPTLYDRTPLINRDRRWALVHAMGELRNEEALPKLVAIAQEPAPPAPVATDDQEPPEGDLVRRRAFAGIGALAALGNAAAESTLVDLAQSLRPEVRHLAIETAVLHSRDRAAMAARLRPLLKADELGLLALRVARPSDMTLPSPTTEPRKAKTPRPAKSGGTDNVLERISK